MTITETAMLMNILSTAYPRFYKEQTDAERKEAIKIWHDFFKDEDSKIVAAALKALIACDEEGYPPNIGKLKARIRQITQPPQMTEMEVWALVAHAASRGMYHSKEEFEKFPPIVKRIVGSPNQLVEWGQIDSNQFQTVIQSNFMRSYRALAQHEQMQQALPDDIKRFLYDLNQKMIGGFTDDE